MVIPAAGRGTRFLPQSRLLPKEMLQLGGRPLIHHALVEAARAGFEGAVVVLAPAKPSIREYCAAAGLPIEVSYAEQVIAAGLGDAVLRAGVAPPFGVLLPDDVVTGSEHWARMLAIHSETGAATLCVRRVPRADVGRFGIAECERQGEGLRVRRLVEKPSPQAAGSDLAIFGRYIVTAPVFEALGRLRPVAGEVQLTDGFATAVGAEPGVRAVGYSGEIYDCGTPESYAIAIARFPQVTD